MTTNNNPHPLDYSKLLKPSTLNVAMQEHKAVVEPILLRRVVVLNGQPIVVCTEEEVERMNVIEELEYVVVGKFAYGWPDLNEIRRILPAQCGIKGECSIGLLRDSHVLTRLTLWRDFVDFSFKGSYYVIDKVGNEYQ